MLLISNPPTGSSDSHGVQSFAVIHHPEPVLVCQSVAQEIEDCWDATEEFSRDDKDQAGFIAPVGKGPAKGGKPNGVPYNFGKSSGTQDK